MMRMVLPVSIVLLLAICASASISGGGDGGSESEASEAGKLKLWILDSKTMAAVAHVEALSVGSETRSLGLTNLGGYIEIDCRDLQEARALLFCRAGMYCSGHLVNDDEFCTYNNRIVTMSHVSYP